MRTLPNSERGYIGPAMAIFMFVLIIVLGLAVDMGGQMRAMQKADDVAREAGRQGAQALDVSAAMAGDAQQVDPGMARAAAERYLALAGVTGQVSVQGGTLLDVTTATTYQPVFLGIIGIGQLNAQGHAQVQLVRVVNGQER